MNTAKQINEKLDAILAIRSEIKRMRILEYVNSKYNRMDSEEREIIVEKILDNYNRS